MVIISPHKNDFFDTVSSNIGVADIIELRIYRKSRGDHNPHELYPSNTPLGPIIWKNQNLEWYIAGIKTLTNEEQRQLVCDLDFGIHLFEHPTEELIQLHNMIWKV